MAENKQYITQTQENGTVMISEDVISTIVLRAVDEVEGVAGFSTSNKKNWGKSLKIVITEDDQVNIDCNINVVYGQSVIDVAAAVQEAVSNAILSMTAIKVSAINVNVCGIIRK